MSDWRRLRNSSFWSWSSPQPYLEMHSGPGRGFPVVYVVGRDEVADGALQPHRLVQGARAAAARKAGRAATDLVTHQTALRGAGADTAVSGFLDAPLGSRRRLRGLQPRKSGDRLCRLRTHRQPRRRVRACSRHSARSTTAIIGTIGLRHTFIPEWKWFSPTASIGTGYQYISEKVPPAPLENHNQLAYVSVGARGFITRRFMWRADWRHYVVFNNLNVV